MPEENNQKSQKKENKKKTFGKPPLGRKPGRFRWTHIIIWLILIVFLYNWYMSSGNGFFGTNPEIEYSEFRKHLNNDHIERVHIKGEQIQGDFKTQQVLQIADGDTLQAKNFITYMPSFGNEGLYAQLEEHDVTVSAEPESGYSWWYILLISLPLIFIIFMGVMFYQRMRSQNQGLFNIGKSKAKLQEPKKLTTTFDEVAGLDNAKKELQEIIEFLKEPKRFEAIGAKLPKGLLMVGPPGTGKTLMAKAVAGEAGVPFYSITGSDFMEMFVGVGAKRVRDMFDKAKKTSPSIIFIDEIDSIGRRRGAGLGGGHDEREQTLNQLLSELDGFEPTESVVVMAATNRPDILDKALLRPGRFDRQISVNLPKQSARHEILKIHAANKKLDNSVDLERVARSTPGFSGADLENLLNEASLYAGRNKRSEITMKDIDQARDKVLMGLERDGISIDDDEKKMLAYHEAGHALVAAVLPHSDPIHKVTIIPRGKAMGVTQQLPEKEKYIYKKEYLLDRLAVIMGGRAAEELIFETSTSGAQDDLKQVAKLSRKMVLDMGMSDRFGHVSFGSEEQEVFLGRDMSRQQEYSDSTAQKIDEEIQNISKIAFERALNTLKENRNVLDKIAELLLEKEEIEGREVNELLEKQQND